MAATKQPAQAETEVEEGEVINNLNLNLGHNLPETSTSTLPLNLKLDLNNNPNTNNNATVLHSLEPPLNPMVIIISKFIIGSSEQLRAILGSVSDRSDILWPCQSISSSGSEDRESCNRPMGQFWELLGYFWGILGATTGECVSFGVFWGHFEIFGFCFLNWWSPLH